MLMTAAALLAVAAPQQALPLIKVETRPGTGYVAIVAGFSPDLLDAVSQRMVAIATQRCGQLKVRFGRFKYFNGTRDGKAEFQNYRQNFSCFDPKTDPYQPVPASWKPTEQDEKDLLAFAERYLQALDRGDYVAGMPMMEPVIEIEQAEWMDVPSKLKGFSGGRGSWTLSTRGWLNNPEGASHPGAYALVKVSGRYPKLAAYCGNLFIYRQRAGSYLVAQQNLRVIPQNWIDTGRLTRAEAVKLCDA